MRQRELHNSKETGAILAEVQQAEELNFTDSAGCKAWVRGLPLTNFAQAQAEIIDQVARLNQAKVAPAERFRMLELLREPANFVQTELAKKFNHKPLPLAEVERKSFKAVIDLWQLLADGYTQCVNACVEANSADKENLEAQELVKLAGAICHRALLCTATSMADHLRANHHFDDTCWTKLHGLYRQAEQLGVADTPVVDPVSRSERTCKGAYVAPILLVLANPHEMFQRHIVMVARWLDRWAEKVTITNTAPGETDKPFLLVDLAAASGAYRNAEPGAEPRWINIDGLSHTMKKRVHYLRKGMSPTELFLGEECVQPACEALLVLLYQHWCDGREARAHPRRSVATKADACSGIQAIHYYISGATFKQPEQPRSSGTNFHDDISTFQRAPKRDDEAQNLIQGFVLEQWSVENETVAGLRLVRSASSAGLRLSPLQLIAVRPEDSKGFTLAVVRWVVMIGEDLTIGVRLLPGTPETVGARSTGINARNEKFQQAFLLPAVPTLQSPASAILAPALYKRDKVLEVHTSQLSKIKLVESLERGYDFERVSFELT